MSSTRRVSAVRLSVSALVCPAISAMRPLSAGSLRGVSIARSILSSRAVNSAATGPLCAAAGGGGGLGAGFDGAAGVSGAAAPTGVVSRDGMTPANQSAAAAPAITAAPISALATCDVKRRADGGEAGAFAPAVACSAASVLASSAAALSAAPSISVAANSIVGGRRPALSSVSIVMPSLLKQLPLNTLSAAKFEQGILGRPLRDLNTRRAGLAQRRGDLLRQAKMPRLCQHCLEQVRPARRTEKIFGTRTGEMQDGIEFAGQRRGCRLGKTLRGQDAIDHDQIDFEIFTTQRSGKVAGPFLAGEIKQPRRRLQTSGDEIGEIVHIAARRGDLGETHVPRRFCSYIADGKNRYAVPLFVPGKRGDAPKSVGAGEQDRGPRSGFRIDIGETFDFEERRDDRLVATCA